jgi:uncharacterized protein
MPLYIVTYEHPDETGWQQHLMPHITWLQDQLKSGTLIASGPFPGAPQKQALLILRAADRTALDALIASDPFAVEGLIANMTVREWDPIFGAFNDQSSMPGMMQGA